MVFKAKIAELGKQKEAEWQQIQDEYNKGDRSRGIVRKHMQGMSLKGGGNFSWQNMKKEVNANLDKKIQAEQGVIKKYQALREWALQEHLRVKYPPLQ